MVKIEQLATFDLWMTDHGSDGLDAKTTLVARFTSMERAVIYLEDLGFTHKQDGGYWHHLKERRHTMGAISYKITPTPVIPINPQAVQP